VSSPVIEGTCDARFHAVRACFERNFVELREIGAALAIHVDGRCVVDLWGGQRERGHAWTADTLVNVYSTTKGLASLCVQQQIDRGALDLDERVASYWPAFGAHGKGEIRLRTLLAHAAGLPAIAKPLPHAALYQHDVMAQALADTPPAWEPGTAHGYHAQTFGFLVAELVRRVSGMTLGQYLRQHIAAPLQADVHIGLAAEHDARVAKVTRPLNEPTPAGEVDLLALWKREPDSLSARAFNNPAPQPGANQTRAYRAAELPSSNGHATALGLSRIYAAVSGGVPSAVRGDGSGVFTRACRERCAEEYAFGPDLVLRVPTRFGPGFMLSQAEGSGRFGPNSRSFGHPGMGGSLGFADPDLQLGFAYVMNRAGAGILIDERARRLIEATYAAI
jgi:CubicO group peptidase (beta-lactamase class C family)